MSSMWGNGFRISGLRNLLPRSFWIPTASTQQKRDQPHSRTTDADEFDEPTKDLQNAEGPLPGLKDLTKRLKAGLCTQGLWLHGNI